MENFAHIKGIVSIILSLSPANILKGAVKFIVHPGRSKPYWIHLLWAFYIFIFLLHFWWWEVYLNEVTNWVFTEYLFIIGYIMLYFVLSHILFPDAVSWHPDHHFYRV
jgi:ABC-type amino acid transport system permease subunit